MDLETVLGLYNYWIVIFLMMTGFYMVIARRNLMKSVIGLNIFQTSVFLLYITMGKIHDGTAPIIPPDVVKAHAGDHGNSQHSPGHDVATKHSDHGLEKGGTQAHAEIPHPLLQQNQSDPSSADSMLSDHSGQNHDPPGSLTLGTDFETDHQQEVLAEGTRLTGELDGIIYSNPLPSVLMLTAIVVGIATTALALSLIVRIREDYGTIDEDKILELDRLP